MSIISVTASQTLKNEADVKKPVEVKSNSVPTDAPSNGQSQKDLEKTLL